MLAARNARRELPCIPLGNEDGLHDEIVAPGPDQPADIPGIVEDGHLLPRNVHHPYLGGPSGCHARLIPVDHLAQRQQPATMLAAARIGPATTDEIAVLLDHGLPDTCNDAPGHPQRIPAEYVFGREIGEEGSADRRRHADENAPSRGPIQTCHLLDDAIRGQR